MATTTVTPDQHPGTPAPPPIERAPGRWITNWDPEDPAFWEGGGRSVARRNLLFSILAEHLGFSVWVIWSIVTVNLDSVGFAFSDSQLFWLVAIPNLGDSVKNADGPAAIIEANFSPGFATTYLLVVSAAIFVVPIRRAMV